MYEVVISTKSSGKVRRKQFPLSDRQAAENYLNEFRERHSQNWKNFRAEIKIVTPDKTN